MADLTATIITYNEEKTIQACLESVTWAKEIVVVDSGPHPGDLPRLHR
jgi:glycosyltransferase involved in cell wall biosynthesis